MERPARAAALLVSMGTDRHWGTGAVAKRLGGAALRQLDTLFNLGVVREATDGQLLERFATDHGEAAELAFAALVERHGPMVLRVCRSTLRDEHDAQDAFQATFLVLVRKARRLWARDSLGPWLHQVAYRAALAARSSRSRRVAHERQAAAQAPGRVVAEGDGEDLGGVLHEEVERLPGRYRAVIVLCDLEGRTHEQAARHLGCPAGTVKSRLARGRRRLRERLARRSLVPSAGGLLLGGLSADVASATPARLVASTIRAAMHVAAGKAMDAGVVSASVADLAERGINAMLMKKAGLVAGVFLSVGAAALVAGSTIWPGPMAAGSPDDGTTKRTGSVARDAAPARESDLAELQGTWVGTSKVPGLESLTWEIDGNALTTTSTLVDGAVSKVTSELKLDEGAEPKALDIIRHIRRTGQLVVQRGIYEIEGGTLTSCFGRINGPRPVAFEAGDPPLFPSLIVFKRPGNQSPRRETAAGAEEATEGARIIPETPPAPITGDLARLQGTWTTDRAGPRGDGTLTLRIEGRTATMTQSDPDGSTTRFEMEMEIDEDAEPKEFNSVTRGAEPRRWLGIYELKGDELQLCIAPPEMPRPTRFQAGGGGRAPELLVLNREGH